MMQSPIRLSVSSLRGRRSRCLTRINPKTQGSWRWQHALHFTAFTKQKNTTKGALIADLRQLNSLLPKPLPFRLPCLVQLDSLLSACRHLKLKLFFTMLDISNMYWACKLPPEWSDNIRFRVRGVSFFVPCLPFGWSYNLVMAIENLARFLMLAHPGQVIIIQHLDDNPLVSTEGQVL